VNGILYFTANANDYTPNDSGFGNELYRSDGTEAGTYLVKDITPGTGSTNISSRNGNALVNVNGTLYFTVFDELFTKNSLWQSDGTGEGTHAVQDNNLADVSNVSNLTAVGTQLFFTGYSYKYGYELYAGNAGTNNTPTVIITSPVNNTSYVGPADIPLTAEIQNFTGTIKKIQFFSGTTLLATQNFYPYTYTWHKVPAGDYYFTAKATDDKGVVTTSEVVHVTVLANKPPIVSITSPADNSSYAGPATIPLVAEASDADGKIKKVQFFSGTTLLATQNFYPYTYTWHNVPAGNYSFTAQAMDDKGVVTTSAVVHVSVKAPDVPFVSMGKANVSDGSNAKLFSTGSFGVKASPNPARNILNIYTSGFEQNKNVTISVVSVSGTVLKTIQKTSNQMMQLDVSSLGSGTYFIKVTSGDKVLTTQFVKL
jgi:ELWxxDGT repeat protein